MIDGWVFTTGWGRGVDFITTKRSSSRRLSFVCSARLGRFEARFDPSHNHEREVSTCEGRVLQLNSASATSRGLDRLWKSPPAEEIQTRIPTQVKRRAWKSRKIYLMFSCGCIFPLIVVILMPRDHATNTIKSCFSAPRCRNKNQKPKTKNGRVSAGALSPRG